MHISETFFFFSVWGLGAQPSAFRGGEGALRRAAGAAELLGLGARGDRGAAGRARAAGAWGGGAPGAGGDLEGEAGRHPAAEGAHAMPCHAMLCYAMHRLFHMSWGGVWATHEPLGRCGAIASREEGGMWRATPTPEQSQGGGMMKMKIQEDMCFFRQL